MPVQYPDPIGGSTFTELLCDFAAWTFSIAVAAAVIAFLLGAYFYLTSGGSPQGYEKGKNAFKYAALGAVVVILSWGTVQILADAIGGTVTPTGCT